MRWNKRRVSPAMSELPGNLSRANGVLAAGNKLLMGAVLALGDDGKLTEWVSGDAVGVLVHATDASTSDTPVSYISQGAEVATDTIVIPFGSSMAEAAAVLAPLIIVLRGALR